MTNWQFNKLCWLIFWLLASIYAAVKSVGQEVQGDSLWALIYSLSSFVLMLMASFVIFNQDKP